MPTARPSAQQRTTRSESSPPPADDQLLRHNTALTDTHTPALALAEGGDPTRGPGLVVPMCYGGGGYKGRGSVVTGLIYYNFMHYRDTGQATVIRQTED